MYCSSWVSNKNINPITNRPIKKKSDIYNLFSKICKNPGACKKYNKNPSINPVTKRQISNTSKIHSFIKHLCVSGNDIKEAKNTMKKSKISKEVFHNFTSPTDCTLYKNIKLKEHQKSVCNYIKKSGKQKLGMILFWSVGSGKTVGALTIVRCLLKKENYLPVFIITPTSILGNFKKEAEKLNIIGENIKFYTHGTFIRKIQKEGNDFCKNSVIIVDEAHRFKTINQTKAKYGSNAKNLMKATSVARYVFLLTATPIQNSPVEITNLYAMISKNESNSKIKKLLPIFENFKDNESKIKKMFKHKINYFKNASLSDYPSVTYNDITFDMSKSYYKLYKLVEDAEIESFNGISNIKNLKFFYNGIRRAVNHIDETITSPKIEWIIDYIKKHPTYKILIYSNWIRSGIKLLQERLDSKWLEINGSMSKKNRDITVKKYNKSKTTNVLFISSAGAEGLDLKNTRAVIITEPHWNYEKIKQVVGRAVRYKSHSKLPLEDRNVSVFNLILKKPKNNKDKLISADEYLIKMSDRKDIIINQFYNILVKSSI